jgi:ferredoxin
MSAVIGASFVHFFDPLVIFERSLTLLFFPVITYFAGLITSTVPSVYTETVIALVVFAGILSLGFIVSRFWCRNACPLGGMYALIAKFAILKSSFGDDCKGCGICKAVCPTGAIDMKAQRIDSSECITCLRCVHECPHNNVQYHINRAMVPFDIRRRQLIGTVCASVIAVPFVRFLIHTRLNGRFIRPPGSIPEADFLNACLRCGKCMKVCPTNGLQPSVLEAGVNGLWTPHLVPRLGGCEKNCNLCGQVCPTGAIRKLPLEEKIFATMGTAVIDRARCIAWEQDKVCLICDEACPFNAISSLNETVLGVTILRPFIDERICTGCGLCEAKCPIEGESAIPIYAIGEERMRSGSYITEEKKKLRACEKKVEDIPSGFILDNQ